MTMTTTDTTEWARASRLMGAAFTRHVLPPAVSNPEVDAAMAQWREMVAQHDAAQAEHRNLMSPDAQARAKAEDTAALADALEAGRKDPGPVAEDKLRAAAADALRRIDALSLAVHRADAALVAAVDKNRTKLTAAANAAVAKRTERVRQLLAELEAETTALSDARRGAEWAAKWPEGRYKGWGKPMQVGGGRGHGGAMLTPTSVPDLLAPLAQAVTPKPELVVVDAESPEPAA